MQIILLYLFFYFCFFFSRSNKLCPYVWNALSIYLKLAREDHGKGSEGK